MHKHLALAVVLIAAPATAQMPPPAEPGAMSGMKHEGMAGMNHGKMGSMGKMGEMMKNTPANPYAEVGMAMHHKMMIVGADASETWTRQMIEHHRGAIAMSKIAVTTAKDKEVRTMAQNDIAMQEKDVASLQSWLKHHGKAAQ